MIDDKKLIDKLKDWIRTDYFEDWSAKNFILNDVIDEINNMPKVSEWIPVSEKLPESDDDVIVTCKSCRTGKKFTSTDYRNCKTGEWSYFGRDVIAWQPLPEPYREESVE